MKKLIASFVSVLLFINSFSQQSSTALTDMKSKLEKATEPEDRLEILRNLGRILINTDKAEAEKYGLQMIQEAEMSRNRELMVKALLYNGERHSFFWVNKESFQKAVDYFNNGLELARENKLETETAQAYLYLSSLYSKVPDLDRSLNYTTQAFAIITTLDNDSLKAVAHNSFGLVYQLKKERLLSLRSYLNALRIAEELKNHHLLRNCYAYLSAFYNDINDHNKAIDYFQMSMNELPLIKAENENYIRVVDLYSLGNLYLQKKNFELSGIYFERSIRLADSLKYEPLKMPGYNGLLNQYLTADQPQRALDFFNKREDLRNFIVRMGFGNQLDNAYGTIYSELGKYDSARYYFEKAEPVYESSSTASNKLNFYIQYADFLNKSGNISRSIDYFDKAMVLAGEAENIEWQQLIARELDTIYTRTGDFKQAYYYNSLYYTFKDSLEKLGEEKDLLQMELQDEQQRQARIEAERAQALRDKHNLQYMGITIAIAVVFLMLVLLGFLRVSETTIRIMGFFAFILLFEFIILLADSKIHHWTHGEPLPILGIKIILIAMLLPLHHWLEKRVVSYLASRRLIVPTRKSIWNTIITRGKELKN